MSIESDLQRRLDENVKSEADESTKEECPDINAVECHDQNVQEMSIIISLVKNMNDMKSIISIFTVSYLYWIFSFLNFV